MKQILCLLFIATFFLQASGQDDELVFTVNGKYNNIHLNPDTATLNYGHTYTFVVSGVPKGDKIILAFDKGEARVRDSTLIITPVFRGGTFDSTAHYDTAIGSIGIMNRSGDIVKTITRQYLISVPKQKALEVYWERVSPEETDIERIAYPGEFSGVYGVNYVDRTTGSATKRPYGSLDVSIKYGGRTRTFHSQDNKLNIQMVKALRKMMPFSKVTIQLNRDTKTGESKTEFLRFKVVTLARIFMLKMINMNRIKRGKPLTL